MPSISETIAKFQRFSAGFQPDRGSADAHDFHLMDTFGRNPGNLRALMHVPANLPTGAPLVVVLHGCTQTANAYDRGSGWSTLADRFEFATLYPEQQRSNNPNLCFNWFAPADTQRGEGEAESVREMVLTAIERHRLDASRVFVTGLSAGGAMTSVMLATHPELFAAGAIIAGLPYGTAANIPEALDRMRGHGHDRKLLSKRVLAASAHRGRWPVVSVWHGTADMTVDPINGAMIVAERAVDAALDILRRALELLGLALGFERRIVRHVAKQFLCLPGDLVACGIELVGKFTHDRSCCKVGGATLVRIERLTRCLKIGSLHVGRYTQTLLAV